MRARFKLSQDRVLVCAFVGVEPLGGLLPFRKCTKPVQQRRKIAWRRRGDQTWTNIKYLSQPQQDSGAVSDGLPPTHKPVLAVPSLTEILPRLGIRRAPPSLETRGIRRRFLRELSLQERAAEPDRMRKPARVLLNRLDIP